MPSTFIFGCLTLKMGFCEIPFPKSIPRLTAMVKHDHHAMTWYDHGDSYSPGYDHGNSMSWSSWNIA